MLKIIEHVLTTGTLDTLRSENMRGLYFVVPPVKIVKQE